MSDRMARSLLQITDFVDLIKTIGMWTFSMFSSDLIGPEIYATMADIGC